MHIVVGSGRTLESRGGQSHFALGLSVTLLFYPSALTPLFSPPYPPLSPRFLFFCLQHSLVSSFTFGIDGIQLSFSTFRFIHFLKWLTLMVFWFLLLLALNFCLCDWDEQEENDIINHNTWLDQHFPTAVAHNDACIKRGLVKPVRCW